MENQEKSMLSKLSLSEAETLLQEEMDELVGGDNYYNCTCPNGGAKSV